MGRQDGARHSALGRGIDRSWCLGRMDSVIPMLNVTPVLIRIFFFCDDDDNVEDVLVRVGARRPFCTVSE